MRESRTQGLVAGLDRPLALLVLWTVLAGCTSGDIQVGDGETLISSDPPIVQGAESPPPEFDTSQLGEEQLLAPVTDVRRIVAHLPDDATGELLRATVLGETPEGMLALVAHFRSRSTHDPLQLRCVIVEDLYSCGGGLDSDVGDDLGGLAPGQPDGGPFYAVGGQVAAGLSWDVPVETSVVTIDINGESRWQRPVSQVAVFATNLQVGDNLELTAYDSEGRDINEFAMTAAND